MLIGTRLLGACRIPFPAERGDEPLGSVGIRSGALPLPENPGAAGEEDQHERGQQTGEARLAAAPDDDPLGGPHRACFHRLAGLKPPEVLGQGLGRPISAAGFLAQALQANRLQVARHGRLKPPGRYRLVLPHQPERRVDRRRRKRRPARKRFVKDGPEPINVHRRGDRRGLSRCLLRGHVTGRADHISAVRQVAAGQKLGHAEVGNLGANFG